MKFEMKNEKYGMKKAGVSLITVLLFMLVATIAATATYKWITSESRSSASRMMEREAYQSSVAGIESAVSWMTYHANDVGALIRQYITSGNKAVNLDNQLAELVRPGQNYHVWLTGVKTAGATYKLKLVSEGVARNGKASHSEVAILNVNGLYKMKIPVVTTSAHADFESAYFGGSVNFSRTNSRVSAAIVNGDLSGSQVINTKSLIVTGNVTQGDNDHIDLAEKTCIGGTITLNNSGITSCGDLYIHGNASTFIAKVDNGNPAIKGNVYFNGNVNYSNSQNIEIKGSVTLNGKITSTGLYGFKVDSNMCLTETGSIELNPTNQRYFTVERGVWIPNDNAIKGSGASSKGYMWLGKDATYDHVYINGGHSYTYNKYKERVSDKGYGLSLGSGYGYSGSGDDWYQVSNKAVEGSYLDPGHTLVADDNTYKNYAIFSSKGTEKSSFPTTKPSDMSCADGIKKYCTDRLGAPTTGCDGSNYKINDVLQTAASTFTLAKYESACIKERVTDVTDFTTLNNGVLTSQLNYCYEHAESDEFYNDYLVVKIPADKWNDASNTTGSLVGKFIIVVEGSGLSVKLPNTSGLNDYVFLYLPNGATSLAQQSGGFNYFIYSLADVDHFNNEGGEFFGSMYFSAANCAKLVDWGSGGSANMNFNPQLKLDLENHHILCPANASTCGGSGGGLTTPSVSTSAVGFGGQDSYYIATAPQLSISIETQYANKESIDNLADNDQAAEGAFIVLPRIVYLSNSPTGELNQYYNVIPLNSRTSISNMSVSCDGAIPVNGKLVPTSQHKLTAGNYTCNVTGTVAGKESTVPFYVVVSSNGDDGPTVSFVEGLKELKKTDPTYSVQLRVPASSPGDDYTITVSYPSSFNTEEWTVNPVGNTGDCPNAEGNCVFTINSATAVHNIFTVKNNSASDGDQLDFQIIEAEGCDIRNPYTETILASSKITVNRESLKDWCESTENSSDALCARKNDPECDVTAEWITAIGSQCNYITANEEWSCKNSADIYLQAVAGNVPSGCEVVIPGTNKLTAPFGEDVDELTLYASLLAKPSVFTTRFVSAKSEDIAIDDDQTIHISVSRKNSSDQYVEVSTSNCTYGNTKDEAENEENCKVPVYYGDRVTLSFPTASDRANFNYWMCESGADCPTPKVPVPTYTYTVAVTGNVTVDAHFEEKDKHCFFDIFRSNSYSNRLAVLCGAAGSDAEYCIDADGKHTNAKWVRQSGDASDIKFDGDGRISFQPKSTHTKGESEKPSVTIMSRVKAGRYGTLKAQFQVPREGVSSGDVSKSTVKQSGFILWSKADASSYLMLNVFSDKDNDLKARVCLNGGTTCMESRIGSASAYQGDVILVAATLAKSSTSGNDILEVRAYTNAFTSDYQFHTFELVQGNLNGVENLASQNNEYVGFRLSDQNFKIHGIGWLSDDYKSECWDTFPIITCSFKAAYAGGIVPVNQDVRPWVGLSKWFDNPNDQCSPEYFYNGDDAGCNGSQMGTTSYKNCSNGYYRFLKDELNDASGPHGNGEENAARAGASSYCGTVRGELAPWNNSVAAAHCGSFWVGEPSHCIRHTQFDKTYTDDDGNEYYGISSTSGVVAKANLREAELIVEMDNTSGAEVRIFLFSQNASTGFYRSDAVYSLPYTTNVAGSDVKVTVNVEALSQVEGFDPENVVGVYVQSEGTVSITSVHSNCPYALGLAGCSAVYNSESDLWTISATVNGASQAGTLDVGTVKIGDNTATTLTGNSKNCVATPPAESECEFTGGSVQTWELSSGNIDSDGHTPYYYIGDESSVTYQFTVSLKDIPGNPVGTCSANGDVDKITATCSSISASYVNQGLGIPQLTYSISGCPAADAQHLKCGYKVKLYKGSTFIKDIKTVNNVSGDVSEVQSGGATETNYGTSETNYLPTGTDYKLVLESTNSDYPFARCERGFEVRDAGASTGNLTCSFPNSGKVVPGQQNLNVSVTTSLPNQQFDLYIDDELKSTQWIDGSGNTQNFTAPTEIRNNHTFKITKKGSLEAECNGTFEVANPLSCSIRNPVRIGVQNTYVFSAASWASCSNCNYSNTLCSNCNDGGVADKNFTVTNNDAVTLSANCQCNNIRVPDCSVVAQAEVVAPTLDCDDVPNKINAEPGANVAITPISVGNCAGGCTYWVNNKATGDKVTPETNGNITTQTSVSFTGESKSGENTYTLSVNNAKGTATCNVLVDYKKPSYSCPDAITAEPGTQITVTPTSVSYCSGGCDYKITGTGIDDIEGENFTSGSLANKIVDTSNPMTGTAVTGGVAKKYSLTLSNAAGSGTACDVTVNYMKPTFTCPGNQEVAVNANVTVTPTNVSYCTKGCSYTISGGSNSAVTGTTGNNYTGGALSNKITGESNATTSGDGTEYTLTLHNPAGDNVEECKFKVKYVAPADLCKCSTYCSDCSTITAGSDTYNSANYTCVFFTGASYLNLNGSSITINNKSFTANGEKCNSTSTCNTFLSGLGLTKVNGGYYMSLPAWNFAQITVTGSVPSVCSSGSGSGGGSGGGESGGGSSTPLTNSSETTLTAGTYQVTCSGANTIGCWHVRGTDTDYTFKLNDADCVAKRVEGWSNCGYGSCKSSAQTLVTTETIKCKAMY